MKKGLTYDVVDVDKFAIIIGMCVPNNLCWLTE